MSEGEAEELSEEMLLYPREKCFRGALCISWNCTITLFPVDWDSQGGTLLDQIQRH